MTTLKKNLLSIGLFCTQISILSSDQNETQKLLVLSRQYLKVLKEHESMIQKHCALDEQNTSIMKNKKAEAEKALTLAVEAKVKIVQELNILKQKYTGTKKFINEKENNASVSAYDIQGATNQKKLIKENIKKIKQYQQLIDTEDAHNKSVFITINHNLNESETSQQKRLFELATIQEKIAAEMQFLQRFDN